MTQLTDPAPPAAQLQDPAPAKPERKLYDQWGRYLLPDPDTGKTRPWTRATTLAKALEDTYNLEVWGMRMVAKGMALRPDLLALAASLDVEADKKRLNDVAKDAKEAAGGSSGANMGTALHALTEKIDAGEKVDPGPFARELAAYRATLQAEGLEPVQDYMERIICVPELGVAGRMDKLLDRGDGSLYQVGDLKSQKSMDFGGVSIAIQLSLYAHAYAVWDSRAEEWTDPPPIDPVMATVIWLPVGRGICQLYDVDIVQGWQWAKLCAEVRRIRKCKPVTRRGSMRPALASTEALSLEAELDATTTARQRLEDPLEKWERLFRNAASLETLTGLGQEAAKAYGGQLPDQLKVLGRELREKLATKAS